VYGKIIILLKLLEKEEKESERRGVSEVWKIISGGEEPLAQSVNLSQLITLEF